MKILITYDIGNDRMRTKISNILVYFGFERIQKSVFLGNPSQSILSKTENQLSFLNLEKKKDSIIILKIGNYAKEYFSEALLELMLEKKVEVI